MEPYVRVASILFGLIGVGLAIHRSMKAARLERWLERRGDLLRRIQELSGDVDTSLSKEQLATRLRDIHLFAGDPPNRQLALDRVVTALMTTEEISKIELEPDIREVWLLTPDLLPDIKGPNHTVAECVRKAIHDQKKVYKYFVPARLANDRQTLETLYFCLGIESEKAEGRTRITIVPVDEESGLFDDGVNTVFYLTKNGNPASLDRAYQEILAERETWLPIPVKVAKRRLYRLEAYLRPPKYLPPTDVSP